MNLDASSQSTASDFKLGDWWVRPQRNELERGEETAHVEARSMEVLVCLARHAPGVVGKERLVEEVWTDSPYIGDDAISHAIWELRKALGDSARKPTYIQTVPRKGYRLLAEILRPQGAPLPMEGVRIEHYDLGEELGRGSMGVVYRATDRRLGRTVAIKFLAAELTRDVKACQRFEREARLAASLDHPNLGTVHEVGETSQGHRYLVSAYYSGGSLKDRLAAGPIELEQALGWVRQLVAGLGAAHRRDIVHRDIKPANLLLDEHGTLKICDFGIAKLLGATDLTRTGAPLGTPAYKSPEQTQNEPVDHRTDLWSAAVVLFELLTGCRPFDGGYEHAVVHSIVSREPRSLEGALGGKVPAGLRRFMGRALAKDPSERYQNAGEMLAGLDGVGAEDVTRPWRPHRRARVGMLVLVAALALTGWKLSLDTQTENVLPEESSESESSIRSSASESPVLSGSDLLQLGHDQWPRGNHPENLRTVRGHFEQAVILEPDSLEAKASLAAFLADSYALDRSQTNHQERARALVDEVLAIDSKMPLALAADAWLLAFDDEIERAEELLLEAVELQGECLKGGKCDLAYIWLADTLWAKGKADEAFEMLDPARHQGAKHIRCRIRRAHLFARQEKLDEAENEYNIVLRMDPAQTTALTELANLYIKTDRKDKALRRLIKLTQETEDPVAWNNLGNAYYMKLMWKDAVRVYQRSHELYRAAGRSVATPLVNAGDALVESGKAEMASVWYEEAIGVFQSIEVMGIREEAQYAVCLAKVGRFREATSTYNRLLADDDRLQVSETNVFELMPYEARIHALMKNDERLFELARTWQEGGGQPYDFLNDAAFIRLRENREYKLILEPDIEPPM
ncbi:MAG: protein kinase [Acidobacteriota bacterium]